MQSHASRHVVSEHLRDRHLIDVTAAAEDARNGAEGEVEISEAFGRRAIPKLLAVLALATATTSDRVAALEVLNSLLTSQEAKAEALAVGAAPVVVAALLVETNPPGSPQSGDAGDIRQRALCCNAIEALAILRQGRQAIAATAGVEALAAALSPVPGPAMAALKAFATSLDGAYLLRECPTGVEAAVVAALGRPQTPLTACRDAMVVLAAMASTDAGVRTACGAQVPAAAVALARRALRLDVATDEGLREVLWEACGCLRALCRSQDGKTQVREAHGIEVLAVVIKEPGADADLRCLAASVLASLAVDIAAKMPVMVHAGVSLVLMLKGNHAEGAAAAAAALRLALESLDARRKVEALLTPAELGKMLGKLPDTPPAFRYVIETPDR